MAYSKGNRKLVNIEGADICRRNFRGEKGPMNDGHREFCIAIDDADFAMSLLEDGWKLSGGDDGVYYMWVWVDYSKPWFAPDVMFVKNGVVTRVGEDFIHELDGADISNFDVTLSLSEWDANDGHHSRVYLKTLYATFVDDPFAYKYQQAANDEAIY